jgi:hypothetical protein
METVLFLSHADAGKPALEALAAAKELGGTLVVGLFGAEVQASLTKLPAAARRSFSALPARITRKPGTPAMRRRRKRW